MEKMTSRERVYTAANFEEPERIPINFGGSEGTGILECPPDGCICSELYSYVKIMVGGAAVTQEFSDRIGADGYAPDANLAVKKAKEILGII